MRVHPVITEPHASTSTSILLSVCAEMGSSVSLVRKVSLLMQNSGSIKRFTNK